MLWGLLVGIWLFGAAGVRVQASEQRDKRLLQNYEDYRERLGRIENSSQMSENGFQVIENQIFPITTRQYGEALVVPAMDRRYHRLVLFLTRADGSVVYRTDQLEANNRLRGSLVQPVRDISAIAFHDLNRDGLMDIVLISTCVGQSGEYAGRTYKVGDVLFQEAGGFYRDYRISDKINRFSMNRSVKCIVAFVRDGYSTEFLYTATTKRELLANGFVISKEQNYARQFEKLGRLEVVPGTYTMADFSTFMIYLINEQGYIVWSFQPMGEFDNLYALKGIKCQDIDGDGMKDILVLARYSYAGEDNQLMIQSDYAIYYQRTGGFVADTEIKKRVYCSEEDTVAGLVERARKYWGWSAQT